MTKPKTFLIHETMNCQVTFVKRVTADDATDALNASWEGCADLLGVVLGDAMSGGESEKVFPDLPVHLPSGMYPEASRND